MQLPRASLQRAKPNHARLTDLNAGERQNLSFLLDLSFDYPGIENWYRARVLPGVKAGTRLVLPIHRDGSLAALGIAKKEPGELKICTIRVAPSYQGRGVGVRLFEPLMCWLGTAKPHLTVSRARYPAFQRIFDWYGFQLTSVVNGLYLPGEPEYLFNEPNSPLLR